MGYGSFPSPFWRGRTPNGRWSAGRKRRRENALAKETGFGMLRILGSLDFSLTGILAGISDVLARAEIGIFAVSTFDTDYILLKEGQMRAAARALEQEGYAVRRAETQA